MTISEAQRRFFAVLVCMTFVCSENVSGQPSGITLFVGNNVSDDVSVFAVQRDGTLVEIVNSPFSAGEDVQAIALTEDGTHLAVSNAGKSMFFEELWLFNIDSAGGMTPVPNSPFQTGDAPLGMAIGGSELIFVPSAADDVVWVFEIDGDDLTSPPGNPFQSTIFPNEIAVTPDNRYVYTSHLFGGISGWRVNANGSLTPLPGSPFATPNDGFELLVTPDGRHLYLAGGLSNDIAGYDIRDDGVLVPLPGSPFASGGTSAVNLAMNPGGDYLFVVHVVSETVTNLARAVDGSLTLVPGSSQFVGSDARKAVASDDHLFVTDDSSISGGVGVMVYSIGEVGLLTLVPGSPFAAGSRPQDMVLFIPPNGSGDGDGDGDVDLRDFFALGKCFSGPDGGPILAGCAPFDTDGDSDVDFADFSIMQRLFTGSL